LFAAGCSEMAVPAPQPPSPLLAAVGGEKTPDVAAAPATRDAGPDRLSRRPAAAESRAGVSAPRNEAPPSPGPLASRPAPTPTDGKCGPGAPAAAGEALQWRASPYASFGPPSGFPGAVVPASAKGEPDLPPAPAAAAETRQPRTLERPSTLPERLEMPSEDAAPHSAAPPLPISLDTVFRLAEDQNCQVAGARERLQEAYAEKNIARAKWLPDVFVGTAFYRHEGGIQLQEGPLVHSSTDAQFSGLEIDGRFDVREVAYQQVNAQRKVWQQKGELCRITSETLLDAANTYIDLLAARCGEAIARELEQRFTYLLQEAQKVADVEKAAAAEVARIEAEREGQRQTIARLRSQAAGAAAKLTYLLQLDPAAEIVPVDPQLVPFDLIDSQTPVEELVAQALRTGPGVRELEGLLALIEESMAKSKGLAAFLPVFEVRMAEGGFGAGPGDRMDWDNRWDLGLQARWNLAPYLTRNDRLRAAQSKMNQAHLAYQDLRGKLTAGVREARETSLGAKEQLARGVDQIRQAEHAYELSDVRRREVPQNTSFFEVLMAAGSVGRAKASYLAAVSEHDKAQLRLMVLLGPAACRPPALHGGPAPAP
jgi:outer membrane protein TolC